MVHTETKSGGFMNSNDEFKAHRDLSSPSQESKFGFSKSSRLLSPKDFQHVFSDAEKFANRHWTLIVRPNQKAYSRLGLAISKKQLQRAVWRNRIKRMAREAFRLHKQDLNGYDIVVLGRKGTQDIDNKTLHNSFLHLVRKIRKSGLKDRIKEAKKEELKV
ncbi:ribonuclease P protein component [Thiomicrorhabdus sp.]|jgi:ribonuclease P protein component|uniref:ribonuclease P protein component n=1 Tax=Thiomicrorhabdus sp. TaxID=2039724 RepID=UPI003562214A